MNTIDSLCDTLSSYLDGPQITLVRRAYLYAEQAHFFQKRRSGEPYVTHPLAVAGILAEMQMDHESLMAAMLHDVIEDTELTKEALEQQFGKTVTDLVDGVSKLAHISFEDKEQQQAENFQKMAMAMAKDIRVILVKLADRLHNMRTMLALRPDKRRRISRETLDIYAPIAHRLGLHKMYVEMEELCFKASYPMRQSMIAKADKKARGHRVEIMEKLSSSVRSRLLEAKMDARVLGREKHHYSIYRKMRDKRKSFSDIMDVFGFRIITGSVDECYRILGLIHGLYKPIPGRFKDYIAIPKTNGYQSLHTTLIGAGGLPIEVQIRTEEMELMANNGIAAHWLYKSEADLACGSLRTQQWVQSLLELQKNAGSPVEFIEHVKDDLFPDEIYVFSPKGKIFELPKGSTPIDFAYAVHTDIGHHCTACRINRRLAPLSSVLQNGQTIEIITDPNSTANPAWLNFIASSRARSRIRAHLKHQRQVESVELGERLLNKALNALDKSIKDLDNERIDKIIKESSLSSMEELLSDIGAGVLMAPLVARRLLAANKDSDIDIEASDHKGSLTIEGNEGLLINFAKCCSPIPGDAVLGYVSSGRGLVVHTDKCNNIQEYRNDPNKCVTLNWAKDISSDFDVNLTLHVESRRSIVAELAVAVHQANANIEKIDVADLDAKMNIIHLTLRAQSRHHLAKIIRRLRSVSGVGKIIRSKQKESTS